MVQDNKSRHAKNLWIIFGLYALLVIYGLLTRPSSLILDHIILYVPLLLMLLHAALTLGVSRGLAFMVLAGSVGFAAEAISLHYGTLFGGDYVYGAGPSLWSVPVAVIAYWSVFIYVGYWLVTSFLYWFNKEKPHKGAAGLKLLGLIVILDGLAVTAIDLFMDPIAVKSGSWTWIGGGPYFGVPIGNFIGWFGVAVISTGLFRLYEYYWPLAKPSLQRSIYILPVVGYLLIGVNFLVGALGYGMIWLAIIGTTITIMPALINLLLYRVKTRTK